jgi:hypothetical protein
MPDDRTLSTGIKWGCEVNFLKWLKAGTQITEEEYRANRQGLNIFFGAVLGIVMGTTENLPPRDFATALIVTGSFVVLIQYLSITGIRRLIYAPFTLLVIIFMPQLFDGLYSDGKTFSSQIHITLMVWAGMVIVVELMPRQKSDSSSAPLENTED